MGGCLLIGGSCACFLPVCVETSQLVSGDSLFGHEKGTVILLPEHLPRVEDCVLHVSPSCPFCCDDFGLGRPRTEFPSTAAADKVGLSRSRSGFPSSTAIPSSREENPSPARHQRSASASSSRGLTRSSPDKGHHQRISSRSKGMVSCRWSSSMLEFKKRKSSSCEH